MTEALNTYRTCSNSAVSPAKVQGRVRTRPVRSTDESSSENSLPAMRAPRIAHIYPVDSDAASRTRFVNYDAALACLTSRESRQPRKQPTS